MIINYWDCEFNNYDELWDGEEEIRIYGCSHPDNKERHCSINNKWCGDKDECPIAALEKA
jgi:hypothetical protein